MSSKPTMFASGKKRQAVKYDDLNDHDRKQYRNFVRFLKLKKAGWFDEMLKRPFWRKYLGLEPVTETPNP